jgi:hypothetical protein
MIQIQLIIYKNSQKFKEKIEKKLNKLLKFVHNNVENMLDKD